MFPVIGRYYVYSVPRMQVSLDLPWDPFSSIEIQCDLHKRNNVPSFFPHNIHYFS
jgi:hypothetical protein